MAGVTVTFAQTVGALYGDLVDVDVLAEIAKLDDPSSAHVPGVLKIARRKKPVAKGFKDLVNGHLLSMRRVSGVHTQGVQRGLSLIERNTGGAPAVRKPAVTSSRVKAKKPAAPVRPTPKEPGNKNLPAASSTDKIRSARAGAERLLATTEGKVALGIGAGGAAYGNSQRKKARDSYSVYKLDDGTKRKIVAIGSLAGAGVGALGLGAGVGEVARNGAKEVGTTAPLNRKLAAGWKKTPRLTRALVPAEVAGVGIEATAGRMLHNDSKNNQVNKAGTFEIAGTFSKFDDDKKRAYGWASVVELEGVPVVDRQGDVIDLEDLEEAAYVYVRKSRITGDMHRRTHDDMPHRVGELIESVVFTPDKCEAMGVSKSLSGKWWIGTQVEDPEAWELVKKGARSGFSVHGKGIRKATTLDDVMYGGR